MTTDSTNPEWFQVPYDNVWQFRTRSLATIRWVGGNQYDVEARGERYRFTGTLEEAQSHAEMRLQDLADDEPKEKP